MVQQDTIIHLVAGGVAGTVGAVVTCPLEVVKTRLQSSRNSFAEGQLVTPHIAQESHGNSKTTCRTVPVQRRRLWTTSHTCKPQVVALSGYVASKGPNNSMTLFQCLRHIIKHEGPMALFKGLGPNLVGVAPSRAIYFCTYSQTKHFWNTILPPDSAVVHVFSASSAGFMASTLTNPIWFVKTRLQLDFNPENRITALQVIRTIYKQSGILGFYKGITASYMGISETIVHFVIYEAIKAELIRYRTRDQNTKDSRDFLEFMAAGAVSKTVASCVAYPHEVARTRLREEGSKYYGFWQTLFLVYKEEGMRGVYRGLTTQLIRQIPNTAIMMATYEAVVYILTTRVSNDFYAKEEA